MINVGERGNFVMGEVKEKTWLAETRVIVWKNRIDHRDFIQGTGESAE